MRRLRLCARFAVAALGAVALGGCVVFQRPIAPPENHYREVFIPQWPSFADNADKQALLESAGQSLKYLSSLEDKKIFYTIGDRQITPRHLAESVRFFMKIVRQARTPDELRSLMADNFVVYKCAGAQGKVVFSSYYEPVFDASPVKTSEYKYPIYRRPPDLIDVNLEEFNPEKFKGERISGRVDNNKLVPYFSRSRIDIDKVLENRGLELAWFKSRLDVTDLHVEGSARLNLTDGKRKRAHFAGTNSLTFRGPITTLVNAGIISKDEFARDKAKEYLAKHPEIEPWLLSTNTRYTFFELSPIDDETEGPEGTTGYPLVAGRSVAVDPKYTPLGALAFIETPMPQLDKNGKLRGVAKDSRFVFCQDTGGAIRGPGRVDYFSGTGDAAKAIATNMWGEGNLYLLVLKFDR